MVAAQLALDRGRTRAHRCGTAAVAGVRPGERAYFAAVGLLALWVGVWGFFVPSRVDAALPFLVPPLHARFLGAMYLSGLVLMVGGLRARRWSEIRVLPAITAVWTGGLFLVSLLHLEAFDLDTATARVTIWFAAYLVYPLVAVGLLWRHRDDAHDCPGRPALAGWVRRYLRIQGGVAGVVAVALLLAPGAMVDVWPWPITTLLAQIYFAPLLAYGVGSVVLAGQRAAADVRIGAVTMLVFTAGVLVASMLHLELFSVGGVADWIWFGAFSAVTAGLAAVVAWSVTAREEEVPS